MKSYILEALEKIEIKLASLQFSESTEMHDYFLGLDENRKRKII